MIEGIKYARELAERYHKMYSGPDAYLDNDYHNGRLEGFRKMVEVFDNILNKTTEKPKKPKTPSV